MPGEEPWAGKSHLFLEEEKHLNHKMLQYLLSFVMAAFFAADALGQAKGEPDRTVLPIAEPTYAPITELDARKAKPPPRFEVKAPKGAPNVVIVLIDDIGFGHSSAFGGPISMPTLEKLAAGGLKYNRFHTTALCSPTRTALLTGHNHHDNNAGAIMELATGFPGNTGIRPRTITTLAEILRQNGYSTAAFGKYHETPPAVFSTWKPKAISYRRILYSSPSTVERVH
jgi:arylsulfatase